MFENVKGGWKLGSETRKLIMGDKQLFMYPILAGIVSILLFVALVASFILVKVGNNLMIYLWLLIYYVAVYFVSTYFIVAMLLAFRSYSKGKRISLGEAMNQTGAYWKLILEWAVFDAIITLIIRVIESLLSRGRMNIGALIFGFVAGLAFTAATFFAIPVIIDEKVGPINAMKDSTKFILKNFGKTFGGIFYGELYSLIFTLGGVGIIVLGAVMFFAIPSLVIPELIIVMAGAAIFVFGMLFSYVISNTVKLIVYDYMTNKSNLPKGWDRSLVESAVKGNPRQQNSPEMPGGFV